MIETIAPSDIRNVNKGDELPRSTNVRVRCAVYPVAFKLQRFTAQSSHQTKSMSTSNSPLSPTSQAQDKMQSSEQDEENQEMPDFNPEDDEVEEEEQEEQEDPSAKEPRPPRETRKDKDLNTFLNSMDKYAPIVRRSCFFELMPRFPMLSQIIISLLQVLNVLISECMFHLL